MKDMARFLSTALLALTFAGCMSDATTTSDPTTEDSSDSKQDSDSSSLCAGVPSATELFDTWAAGEPTPSSARAVQNFLDAVVETGTQTRVAVTRDVVYGSTWEEQRFLLSLDKHGNEIGRAPGRYIDRIGPDAYLLDKAQARATYTASNNPLYYSPLDLYASDHDGTKLWSVAAHGNTQLSKVFRIGAHNFLVVGIDQGGGQPTLTYFDGSGNISDATDGDPRACSKQAHAYCIPANVGPCAGL